MQSPESISNPERIEARRACMAVLARATHAELETLMALHELPDFVILKQPETGTVMVEGRAGGAGSRFNLGEATVTRCVVRLASGTLGFSYSLGRDKEKARLAAIAEAILQEEAAEAVLGEKAAEALLKQKAPEGPLHLGLATLAARQQATKIAASRKAAATKVEFFTLVRGEG